MMPGLWKKLGIAIMLSVVRINDRKKLRCGEFLIKQKFQIFF